MEPNQDEPQVLETAAPEATPEDQPVEPAEPQADDKDQKIAELEKTNKQLFERAKKAELKVKEAPPPAPAPEPTLSEKDRFALYKGDVSADDIDDVLEYARFKKLTVSDALKSSVVTNMLAEKKEQRRTAEATQTRNSPRGTTKVSGAELLAKANRTGEVPDTDEGMQALVLERLAKRFPSKKA